jgi:heat shock protein HslJ
MRMIAVAGVLLTLAACGDESSAGGSLKGKSYLSTAVTENGQPKQLAPNTQIRLQFTDDGRLIADAGCNSMQSPVSTGNGKLSVEDLAMTEMGCDAPRHAQDDWLAKLLQNKPTWKLEADTLTVASGGTTISLLDRKTAEPDRALEGTKWSLETVITGEVASHQAGSEKAWITFNGERVTGSTGCNELQGVVARSTGKLTFGDIATTRRACAGDAATLETALLNGLKGEVTFEIDSTHLELRSSTNGLDFTATR